MQTRSDSPGALLDNLLTAVILVDGDFVVHYVNPAAEQLLGGRIDIVHDQTGIQQDHCGQ